MELQLSSNFSGKPVSVVVPIEKVIEVFWPKDEKPPISLTVSTVLGADSANAEFSLGEETKESYPGIWLTTDNVKSHRHCSWFRLELPNDTNDIVINLKTLWSSWKTLSFPTTSRSLRWLQAVWKLWDFQSRRVITTRTTSPPLMCPSSLSASITLF